MLLFLNECYDRYHCYHLYILIYRYILYIREMGGWVRDARKTREPLGNRWKRGTGGNSGIRGNKSDRVTNRHQPVALQIADGVQPRPMTDSNLPARPKHPGGRPSLYSLELAAEICGRLIGGESLSKICRDDHMPSVATVTLWRAMKPEFSAMYARAREDQADTFADQIVAIANEPEIMRTTIFKSDEKNGQSTEVIESDSVQHRKLKVDTLKWVASKQRPRSYGDRIDLTNSDGSLAGSWSSALRTNELDKPLSADDAEPRH